MRSSIYREALAKGIEQGRVEGIERGRVEGIERGRVEGIERGIERGRLDALRQSIEVALSVRKVSLSSAERARLEAEENSETLARSLARAITANDALDVFEDR